MFNGLPGTGIGGMFYLLSAIVMVIIEFTKKLAQWTASARWKDARLQLIIISGITLALSGSAMVLDVVLRSLAPLESHVVDGGWIISLPRTYITIIILVAVLGGGEAFRMLLTKNKNQTA